LASSSTLKMDMVLWNVGSISMGYKAFYRGR
jgi:hypothetical protein